MNTIEELIIESNMLLDNNQNLDATLLVESGFTKFPLETQTLLYCLLCIHSINQDKKSVLEIFERARQNDVWWAPDMIRNDDDFAWLLKDVDFQNELSRLQKVFTQAKANSKMITQDRINSVHGYWIVNLHKKNNSIERTLRYFENSNVKLGVNTRYIQSSQATSSNGFSWDDKKIALADLINSTVNFSVPNYILCGTSQGGDIAFVRALESGMDYLGVMPAISAESIAQIKERPKGRFVFLIGDNDPYRVNVVSTIEKLRSLAVDVELLSTGDIGHWLPDNFDKFYEMSLQKMRQLPNI